MDVPARVCAEAASRGRVGIVAIPCTVGLYCYCSHMIAEERAMRSATRRPFLFVTSQRTPRRRWNWKAARCDEGS